MGRLSKFQRWVTDRTILPNSKFYRIWEAIVVIAILIVVFLHPYDACFSVTEFTGTVLLSDHNRPIADIIKAVDFRKFSRCNKV